MKDLKITLFGILSLNEGNGLNGCFSKLLHWNLGGLYKNGVYSPAAGLWTRAWEAAVLGACCVLLCLYAHGWALPEDSVATVSAITEGGRTEVKATALRQRPHIELILCVRTMVRVECMDRNSALSRSSSTTYPLTCAAFQNRVRHIEIGRRRMKQLISYNNFSDTLT